MTATLVKLHDDDRPSDHDEGRALRTAYWQARTGPVSGPVPRYVDYLESRIRRLEAAFRMVLMSDALTRKQRDSLLVGLLGFQSGIDIAPKALNPAERRLIEGYRQLPTADRNFIRALAERKREQKAMVDHAERHDADDPPAA